MGAAQLIDLGPLQGFRSAIIKPLPSRAAAPTEAVEGVGMFQDAEKRKPRLSEVFQTVSHDFHFFPPSWQAIPYVSLLSVARPALRPCE